MQLFATGATALLYAMMLSALGAASVSHAQTKSAEGKAEAGRTFAFQSCSGCHIVAPDQPFMPTYIGPPSFREIANQSNTTAASLQYHLETLPLVPEGLHMAKPSLSTQQLQDIVAFIISLRHKSPAPAR